jgi:hypothetical protein
MLVLMLKLLLLLLLLLVLPLLLLELLLLLLPLLLLLLWLVGNGDGFDDWDIRLAFCGEVEITWISSRIGVLHSLPPVLCQTTKPLYHKTNKGVSGNDPFFDPNEQKLSIAYFGVFIKDGGNRRPN